jgi:hypothetical protein
MRAFIGPLLLKHLAMREFIFWKITGDAAAGDADLNILEMVGPPGFEPGTKRL